MCKWVQADVFIGVCISVTMCVLVQVHASVRGCVYREAGLCEGAVVCMPVPWAG